MRARPNNTSSTIEADRTASWTDASQFDSTLSTIPSPANAVTNPATTNRGRSRVERSIELLSRMGSKGNTQGEAIVRTPATRAIGPFRTFMVGASVVRKHYSIHAKYLGYVRTASIIQSFVSTAPAYTVRHIKAVCMRGALATLRVMPWPSTRRGGLWHQPDPGRPSPVHSALLE